MKNCTPLCPYKERNWCPVHQGYTVPQKTEVNKVSEKKKELDKQYRKLRAKFLKENPKCLPQLVGCTKRATDVHHMAGRIGDEYLNVKNFLPVCRKCHDTLEKSPAAARRDGFSKSRLAKN